MEKRTFVALLGQGAAAYAMTSYVIVVALMLYHPNVYNFFYMALLPAQLLIAGIVGAVAGGAVWLVERLLKRRLNILARAAVGIGLVTLADAAFLLFDQLVLDWRMLIGMLIWALVGLPPVLMAGSRFHPLRRIVFGSCRTRAIHDFGSGFSFPPALVLRVVGLFGLLEALLFLVYVVSSRMPWTTSDFGGDHFLEGIIATLYFAATLVISLTPSLQKLVLLASTLIVNVTPLVLLMNSSHYVDAVRNSAELNTLFVVVGTFWLLWALMVFGRLVSFDNDRVSQHRRLFPLTMWEIEIRHVFGRW